MLVEYTDRYIQQLILYVWLCMKDWLLETVVWLPRLVTVDNGLVLDWLLQIMDQNSSFIYSLAIVHVHI